VFQLKLALRALRRQPLFIATAVGALALGIAAPTALFAVVQATLLRPLPYASAGDIYTVRTAMTDGRFTIGLVGSEELASLRRSSDRVMASALVMKSTAIFAPDGDVDATQLAIVAVSEGFFDLFGVPMARGRAFGPDDYASTTVRSAVLSDQAWRTVFAADAGIVGKTIRLSTGPALVVGVAPKVFDAPHDTDIWLGVRFEEDIGHTYDAYVRLRPGSTPQSVQSALGPMWAGLAKKYPDQERNRAFVFRPLLASIVGDLGPTALIAFAATALLLLLAIANVANLLLARGATRARDLAVRVALGASRWDLIQQLLAESMVIAVASAAIGIPLAALAVRGIALVGGAALPRVDGLRFDPLVACFAAGVMILAGVAIGLLPAMMTGETAPMSMANEGGRGGMQSRHTRRWLGALVVCEIMFAIALVAGAGRLLLSARNLLAVDTGFIADGRLVVDVQLPQDPYNSSQPRSSRWSADAVARLHALGATYVGVASTLPLRREWDFTSFTDIAGRPVDPQFRPNARMRIVNRELFDALGIRVVAGRGFTVDDRAGSTPVVVVNEAWAAKFLPGIDPLREHITGLSYQRVGDHFESRLSPIVGVVNDVRYSGIDRNPEPVVYLVDTQQRALRLSLVVTTADGHPERLVPRIRAALRAIDPNVPVQFDTMSNAVAQSMLWSRLGVLLMSTFGVVSLLLMGTGVFGVLAFVGAQRHGEMAVRLSLGATRANVFGLMLTQGLRLAVMGAALGSVLAWWMGRWMSGYVYHVSSANVWVLGGSAAVVMGVALAATLAPARRAALVEPSRALRS
jgi:putative ABC transport system permease protein